MKKFLIFITALVVLASCSKDEEIDNSNFTKVEYVEGLSYGAKISVFDYGKRESDYLPVEGKIFEIKANDNFYVYTYDLSGGVPKNPDNVMSSDGGPAKFGFKINGKLYEFLYGDEVYLYKTATNDFTIDYVRRRGD